MDASCNNQSHRDELSSENEVLAKKAQLAVFDFDGTSIEGNSPVMLVSYLARKRMLRKRVVFKIMLWGLRYKLRLPQDESWVRGQVFSAFEGKPVRDVDAFLSRFYEEVVAHRFRPDATEAMVRHAREGMDVVVVSASFEPIILRAMEDHPFQFQISTRMRKTPDGTYTREVEGLPVEGDEKLAAVTRFANERYGKGNWVIAHAYGDHHSDRTVLKAAVVPHAVDPDRPLLRTARKLGWDVLDW
ncbi:MAG TPA: HAD-IB family hydrolase [Candidatus Aphodovivens excrementavium]|nr:HAD-IB family hydrolase [Candidatus Aphodovivens excrementavium]